MAVPNTPSAWALKRGRSVRIGMVCFCSKLSTCGTHTNIAFALDATVAERDEGTTREIETWKRNLEDAQADTAANAEDARQLREVIREKDADIRETLRAYSVHIPRWIVDHLERALSPTPVSLRERAAAERRVIEAAVAWAAEDAHGDGSQRSHEARQAATDDLFRAAHALVTQPAPPAQPHDHNGNCRCRRSIVHTPGEERGDGHE